MRADRTSGVAPIERFRGEWFFLSNFSPATVTFDGLPYPTVEHVYQAARCARLEDREAIRRAASPSEAKRLGRASEELVA